MILVIWDSFVVWKALSDYFGLIVVVAAAAAAAAAAALTVVSRDSGRFSLRET